VLAACGGKVDAADNELDVADDDSTSAAISSPDPGATAGGDTSEADDGDDDGDRNGAGDDDADEHTDKDCKDGDSGNHHHHHHHKFKLLDRLDGAKDKVITIASLPAGLPERLIAKLHKLDKDGDGLVTRAEVKAHKHRKHHRER
jgi:hypothetical protein